MGLLAVKPPNIRSCTMYICRYTVLANPMANPIKFTISVCERVWFIIGRFLC